MKRFFGWIVRLTGGAVLLILTALIGWTIVDLPVTYSNHPFLLPVIAGSAVGLCLFTLVPVFRLVPVYVAGHEFVHWLTAKLFRRRTGKFSVRACQGSVKIEDPNIWIVLAPYVVPIFPIVWIGLYGVFKALYSDLSEFVARIVLSGGVGFTYAHHIVVTAKAVMRSQPDFGFYGLWVSLPAVLAGNLLVVWVALMLVTNTLSTGLVLFGGNANRLGRGLMEAAGAFM